MSESNSHPYMTTEETIALTRRTARVPNLHEVKTDRIERRQTNLQLQLGITTFISQ